MNSAPDLMAYAQKMRQMAEAGTDFEVDARFVDMLCARGARILDLGCGIGSAVNGLRRRGHEAFGVDPSETVLSVARDLFVPDWYRNLGVEEIRPDSLRREGWPGEYDVVLISGNVPAFLSPQGLIDAFLRVSELLEGGGLLVVGTTANVRGGPTDQDKAVAPAGLTLIGRYSDWHLSPFTVDNPWSVSVYANQGKRAIPQGPDGVFILNRDIILDGTGTSD